jgi:two-component system, cell cycle sensor histidine kinase and response regulator CckA
MDKKPTVKKLTQKVKELEIGVLRSKGIEEKLQESEEKYRQLFRTVTDAIVLFDAETRQFIDANDAALNLYGYTREEFLRLRHRDITAEPEQSGVSIEQTLKGKLDRIPVRYHKAKDGTRFPVEISANTFTLKNREVLCGVVRDITDRKRSENELKRVHEALERQVEERTAELVLTNEQLKAEIKERKQTEKELRKSEERYRTVVEDMPAMICRFLPDGILTFVNSTYCDYFNKKNEELIEQNFFQFIPEEDQEEVRNHFNSLNHMDPMITYEHQVIASDGNIRWQQWTDRAIFDEQGRLIEYQSVGKDITEEKLSREEKFELESQLQHARKMQAVGTLASGFAHNFNNVLMGIMANASIMLLDLDADHPHYNYLKKIENQARNGSKVVRQLTGYTRGGRLELTPLDLNRLLMETVDTFKMVKKGIRIHKILAENLYAVLADKVQVEQVLLNLYLNAADAMSGDGDLFLKTMNVKSEDIVGKPYTPEAGNYVLLTVRDTGIGMDKEVKERIFEPFFTTKDVNKGIGLGLSSTYAIVKSHRGYIDVDSEKGHGTFFNIYLPATEKEVNDEAEVHGKILKGYETVLLVDDEDMVIEGCGELLDKTGYTVLTARGGEEAIETYKRQENPIDLVILDMIMPEMDGGETYKRLKEINPDIKVLLSSGHSIDDQTAGILKRGCDGFIQKPFDIMDLSKKIREILDKK